MPEGAAQQDPHADKQYGSYSFLPSFHRTEAGKDEYRSDTSPDKSGDVNRAKANSGTAC